MKIIINNVVFVQKKIFAYLSRYEGPIPASIFMKALDDDIVIINDSNKYEFMKFDAPEEIEFFKNADWIIDYNEVKDLSDEEIIALAQKACEERNAVAYQFNSMSLEERKENASMIFRCELLDFKTFSLIDFLRFKKGHLRFDLPEGLELPRGEQQSGFGKLIRSIFNKGKNKR